MLYFYNEIRSRDRIMGSAMQRFFLLLVYIAKKFDVSIERFNLMSGMVVLLSSHINNQQMLIC